VLDSNFHLGLLLIYLTFALDELLPLLDPLCEELVLYTIIAIRLDVEDMAVEQLLQDAVANPQIKQRAVGFLLANMALGGLGGELE